MLQDEVDWFFGHVQTLLCRNFNIGAFMHFATQNKKYLCAIGSTVAGSQVSNIPSARTS
jgi:hypothetical protein